MASPHYKTPTASFCGRRLAQWPSVSRSSSRLASATLSLFCRAVSCLLFSHPMFIRHQSKAPAPRALRKASVAVVRQRQPIGGKEQRGSGGNDGGAAAATRAVRSESSGTLRLRAPGCLRERAGAGNTAHSVALADQYAPRGALGENPRARGHLASSSPSSSDGDEGNKGPVSGDSWANHARQHLSACGYAVPASPARTADGGGSGACVEGISPATRRYGAGAGEGSRGRGWFPREIGSPFPAEDKRGRLSLNLCYSKSSKAVLTLIADALRWTTREASAGPGANASIYWAVAPEEVEEMLIMHKPKQRVGRLPGMHDLCRKVPFARVLDFFAARSPDVYDFHPRSVCLPAQADARCDSLFRHGPAILKPDDGTQGDGIYLVNSKEEAMRRMQTAKLESAVLQEYIARPLLIDGYKFDIRVYVLVLSLQPLRLLLCKEGLVRVCSQLYRLPDKHNVHKQGMHLTNFSVNKTSAQYIHNDNLAQGARGGKRTLSAVLEYLAETHAVKNPSCDVNGLWSEVRRVVTCATIALAEAMQDRAGERMADLWPYRVSRSTKMQGCATPWDHPDWGDWRSEGFHVLGCDVMFDETGKAYVLEMNANPSMAYDSIHTLEQAGADWYQDHDSLAQDAEVAGDDRTQDTRDEAGAALSRAGSSHCSSEISSVAGEGTSRDEVADGSGVHKDAGTAVAAQPAAGCGAGAHVSRKEPHVEKKKRPLPAAAVSAVASAAAASAAGCFKAGGAEGRRRRKEEEARLAQIAKSIEESPPPLPDIPLIEEAMGLCKGRGVRLCRCLSHHRPHLHRPCVIDLAIKQACLGGALAIVGRDILAQRAGTGAPSATELAKGTCYQVLADGEVPAELMRRR